MSGKMMDEEQSDGRVFFLDGRDGRVFLERKEWESFLWERWESTYTGNINQSKPRCFVLGFLIFFTPVVLVL